MADVSRGLGRLWLAIVILVEAGVLVFGSVTAWRWHVLISARPANVFDQFDPQYSLWDRLEPVLFLAALVPFSGLVVWLTARWIASGFSN